MRGEFYAGRTRRLALIRAGEADGRIVALVLVLAVLVAGLIAIFGRTGDPEGGAEGIQPRATGPAVATDRGTDSSPLRAEVPGAPDPSRTQAAGPAEPHVGRRPGTPDPRRFDGPPGTIRGQLVMAQNDAVPRPWTLVLEPSRMFVGSEHAERREIEFTDGRSEFEVADLPLAGYDVRAVAEGMNGLAVPVILERRSPQAHVTIQLARAGYLEGVVFDTNGAGVEALDLTLESLADGRTRTTTTDVVGNFHFAGVQDGQYKLHYGHPASPVAEARTLQLRAPGMTMPPATVPVLSGMWVLVLTAEGKRVPGAKILGTGTTGGYVEGVTDDEGLLRIRHLPPGRYRIRAEHPDHGNMRTAADLEEGSTTDVTVTFR